MSEEETRGIKKSFTAIHEHMHAYKAGVHSAALLRRSRCIVESTCVVRTPLSIAGSTELNEFTAGHTLLRGLLHVPYDGDDDGDVGMRTLTLVRAFVLHGAWSSLHGPPAVQRIEDKRALGGAVAPVHDRLRNIV